MATNRISYEINTLIYIEPDYCGHRPAFILRWKRRGRNKDILTDLIIQIVLGTVFLKLFSSSFIDSKNITELDH